MVTAMVMDMAKTLKTKKLNLFLKTEIKTRSFFIS